MMQAGESRQDRARTKLSHNLSSHHARRLPYSSPILVFRKECPLGDLSAGLDTHNTSRLVPVSGISSIATVWFIVAMVVSN